MGIAKLYGQKASGMKLNATVKEYQVYSGATIKAGDFVEIVSGTQVRKTTTSQFDGVAKTSGVGGTTTVPNDLVSIYTLEPPVPPTPTTYERCDVVFEVDSGVSGSVGVGWISDASGTLKSITVQPGTSVRLSDTYPVSELPYLGADLTKNYNIVYSVSNKSYIIAEPELDIATYTPVGAYWSFKSLIPNTVGELHVRLTGNQ